jgi:HD-GYP domain-containing protein (c-di-GMP phosphodiesterase class II)/DNA-binding CsgD family transcriptional regulator
MLQGIERRCVSLSPLNEVHHRRLPSAVMTLIRRSGLVSRMEAIIQRVRQASVRNVGHGITRCQLPVIGCEEDSLLACLDVPCLLPYDGPGSVRNWRGGTSKMDQHASSPSAQEPTGMIRTADVLGALSTAADLALGMPEGHAARSCYLGMAIANQLNLSPEEKATVYYSELLMDAGCTSWAGYMATAIMGDEIGARRDFYFNRNDRNLLDVLGWLQQYMAAGAPTHIRARRILDFSVHGKAFTREALQNTAEVARHFADRLGMPDEVQSTLWSVFEQWDGKGPNRARGDAIPIASRIVFVTSLLEAFYTTGGRTAALRVARARRGTAFDPLLVEAFLALSQDRAFWEAFEEDRVWETVLSMEPLSPYRFLPAEQLADVAMAFADFADLKSFYAAGHSRRVGDLAARIACRMLGESEAETVRLAGLTHDLGLVAVPSFVLHKSQEDLTAAEREQLRLHPYHAERILARIPAFRAVIPLVGAHQERVDGQGYYRGLTGSQIPLGARILAVANRYDELTQGLPGHPPLDSGSALERLYADAGKAYAQDCARALEEELRADGTAKAGARGSRQRQWPGGLTSREVELLRLLAGGLSRREVATQLFLSEHTVRHHLEHIYDKIGVHTRVAATLFAVEHDLLN